MRSQRRNAWVFSGKGRPSSSGGRTTGNEPTEKSPEFWQGTIETPRVAVSQTVTKDCCDLDDPCLCMLKKKLKEEGKEPDIWCLKKKVLVDKC